MLQLFEGAEPCAIYHSVRAETEEALSEERASHDLGNLPECFEFSSLKEIRLLRRWLRRSEIRGLRPTRLAPQNYRRMNRSERLKPCDACCPTTGPRPVTNSAHGHGANVASPDPCPFGKKQPRSVAPSQGDTGLWVTR